MCISELSSHIRTNVASYIFIKLVQYSQGVNSYCRRIQGSGNSAVIRIYCLSGGCDMSSQLLWFRIVLSPPGE